MNLLVVAEDGPSLLGQDYWCSIQTAAASACQEILDQHETLFKDELGTTAKATTAKFNVEKVKAKVARQDLSHILCVPRRIHS